MTKQESTDKDKPEDDDTESEWWINIKHRMECSQCEHAYYIRSECAWYCIRKHKITEGYCEY
jgi:hypothetical protein